MPNHPLLEVCRLANPERRGWVSRLAGVTYDTGALIAVERRDPRMLIIHQQAADRGVSPVVPAGVLAQVWRGGSGRQAILARILQQCQVESLDEGLAK